MAGPGAGGAGLIVMAVVFSVRWMRWVAGGRLWRVRVTRHPTLKGDDQTSRIVAETERLHRAAALERAHSIREAIRHGDIPL